MGKICSKINFLKKKSDLGVALVRGERRSIPRLIEITRKRYRKKSKNRRYRNKNESRRT